ncbi:MAG: PD40 domain-containing protein, partial [Gemmatimonadetes bacterium]|nr:PD40 domain-containing protein [Gemmatimonadota bacterium]
MFRILTIALVVLAVGSQPGLDAQDLPGMPSFKEVLSLNSVGSTQISPDGQTVAYTVRSTDWEKNSYDTEIWIARADGQLFQLTRTADGSSSSPQWSPDGRWIAFATDRGEGRQVHLIALSGGEAMAITEVEGGVGSFSWAPTGDRMLLSIREQES